MCPISTCAKAYGFTQSLHRHIRDKHPEYDQGEGIEEGAVESLEEVKEFKVEETPPKKPEPEPLDIKAPKF